MLNRAIPTDKKASPPLRICTICDGVDSVIRLAAWLSQLPNAAERVDLDLTEALDHLGAELSERFDLLAIAIATDSEVMGARLVQRILDCTASRCAAQVVLVPPSGRLTLREGTRAQVLEGPPFPTFTGLADLTGATPPPEVAQPEPESQRLLSRIFRRYLPEQPVKTPDRQLGRPLRVLSCWPVVGGAGASTVAVNLARALSSGPHPLEVCLIDLDPQFGALAGYLGLSAEQRIYDAYRNFTNLDLEGFGHCLRTISKGLKVFTAPEEILPIDAIERKGLQHLVSLALAEADVVILDLPPVVADWTDTAFALSDRILLVAPLEVRAARSVARLRNLAGAESMAPERLLPVVTGMPRKPSKEWNARLAGFEKGLGLKSAAVLPAGGDSLTAACDAGAALDQIDPHHPFLDAIAGLADQLRLAVVPSVSARRVGVSHV